MPAYLSIDFKFSSLMFIFFIQENNCLLYRSLTCFSPIKAPELCQLQNCVLKSPSVLTTPHLHSHHVTICTDAMWLDFFLKSFELLCFRCIFYLLTIFKKELAKVYKKNQISYYLCLGYIQRVYHD